MKVLSLIQNHNRKTGQVVLDLGDSLSNYFCLIKTEVRNGITHYILKGNFPNNKRKITVSGLYLAKSIVI